MSVRVILEDGKGWSYQTGGEYAVIDLEIHVDKSLTYEEKQELIIHSIIENYCRSWSHDKVEELGQEIWDGLLQLKENEKGSCP
jgi:hypothetical protein